MKLPFALLLYTSSLGLVGLAGWTVYKMVPLWSKETREAATAKGMKDATDRMGLGRGKGPVSADWQYSKRTADWWAGFKDVNFTGKLPPPPPPPVDPNHTPEVEVVADVRPLDQIIELVSLVYDSRDQGKGELSHVVVRYRLEANVQPPEWYVRETTVTSAGPVASPRDVAAPRTGGNPNGPQGKPAAGAGPANRSRNPTPMPTSLVGREVLQKIWIQGDGDPRRDPKLWPPFADIKLVRVDPDAQSAYFIRIPPPPKAGQVAQEPKEERLVKAAMGLSQDLLQQLHRLQGKSGTAGSTGAESVAQAQSGNTWQDVAENTLVGNVLNIGRKEEQQFRENPDELWEKIHVDTYTSKVGSAKGLQIRSVDTQVAAKYGVVQGDVLIEINNRPVQTQAQAVQFGKGEYRKGVRTFVTKWLSGGQVVERIYQAPDR